MLSCYRAEHEAIYVIRSTEICTLCYLGEVSAEEGEELWPQAPPSTNRRVSIDTIATEPWLRPSSIETLKKFMGGRRPSSQNHDWEGPSTYHG